MFQQSIPRLLPDSDIVTYHWPFILIDDQTGQFWSKVVFNFETAVTTNFDMRDTISKKDLIIISKVRLHKKIIIKNEELVEIKFKSEKEIKELITFWIF